MTNSLQHHSEILQDRFGLKLAARLNEGQSALPHDINERLRVARSQAVARRKQVRLAPARAVHRNGATAILSFGDDGLGLWGRIASVLPLIALVVGLVSINAVESKSRATELAEVDSALLTDDLPPAAYADPGFIQFLKTSSENTH